MPKTTFGTQQSLAFITAVGNKCPFKADVWSEVSPCERRWLDIVWVSASFDQFKPAGAAEDDYRTLLQRERAISGLQWIGSYCTYG